MDYPIIPAERGDDLHNLKKSGEAALVLFMAGNQFMLMPELIRKFRENRPRIRPIAYETLPPGLELSQILAGGAVFQGRTHVFQPDVYSSVSGEAMDRLTAEEFADPADCFVYLRNRLALMVARGNPQAVSAVTDLGRDELVVSQPNPEYEHIAAHTIRMYEQAGGSWLVDAIMEKKRAAGTTLLTTVHHRQTPQRLVNKEADAGPVWHTEVVAAEQAGLAVEGVPVAEALDQRDAVKYYITPVKTGRNPENAREFLDFIKSPPARDVFCRYGFTTVD
ncbi:MAG: substrate-binding domain-containing protein [Desulfosalsimonadaceae bacterium]